jgi:NgoFVII restriction endonuclease N-terminal PLD domain
LRIYLRGSSPTARHGLISLLLSTLDAEAGEILLVSPWIRDIAFRMEDHPGARHVFRHVGTVRLSDVLGALSSRHAVHVITKPPDELVSADLLSRLRRLDATLQDIRADTDARGIATVDDAVHAMSEEARALAQEATRHGDGVATALKFREIGAHVSFLAGLHAKLLWTPAGALIGSANFTHAGFERNEELMVEVTTEHEHEELRGAAHEIERRSTPCSTYALRHRRARTRPARLALELDRWRVCKSSTLYPLLAQLARDVGALTQSATVPREARPDR